MPEGSENVNIGEPIAIIVWLVCWREVQVENKDDIPKFASVTKESLEGKDGESASAPAASAPVAPAPATPAPAAPAASATPAPAPAIPATPTPAPSTPATPSTRVFISPLAKTILRESGAKVDLSKLQGSGPSGRVLAKDVLAAISAATPAAPAASQPSAAFEDVAVTPMRKIISARLTESKQTIPHYYVNQNCYVDELLQVGLRRVCESAPQATERGHRVGARRHGGREAREGDDQRLHREGVRDGVAGDAGGELQLRQQHDAPLQDDRHQRRRVGGGR